MLLSFPKLREKCETHVCLVDNRYGDERWESIFEISREEKDRKCHKYRATLETLYHQETENARLNSLGGYVGVLKEKTERFGIERRKCTIDKRGIFVMTDQLMQRIITSFRPIIASFPPPASNDEFKRDAFAYYKKLTTRNWGQ